LKVSPAAARVVKALIVKFRAPVNKFVEGLKSLMHERTIASLTPTVCALFGIEAPALAGEPAAEAVLHYAQERLGGEPIERCLVYCPDALGEQIWSKCAEHPATIAEDAPCPVWLSSVVPPVTPVCFASVFTGAQPERHGIRHYERPVLRCDTLFDALIRRGKRVALVAVRNCSVDLIFRDRAIDYFSEPSDQEVTDRALAAIAENAHHLVVTYHQEYDDLLHKTQPFSAECLQAAAKHVASFRRLAEAARKAWAGSNHAIVFAPDHGAHIDPTTGHGDHGLDIAEDMSLRHWYGVIKCARRDSN